MSSKAINKVFFGLMTISSLFGMNATGCSVGLDDASCVMAGSCGDEIFQPVQEAPLKQVAIY